MWGSCNKQCVPLILNLPQFDASQRQYFESAIKRLLSRPANLVKRSLLCRCFHVSLAKFLSTAILQSTCKGYQQTFTYSKSTIVKNVKNVWNIFEFNTKDNWICHWCFPDVFIVHFVHISHLDLLFLLRR